MSTINALTLDATGALLRWENGMADTVDSLIRSIEGEDEDPGHAGYYADLFDAALALVSRPYVPGQPMIERHLSGLILSIEDERPFDFDTDAAGDWA